LTSLGTGLLGHRRAQLENAVMVGRLEVFDLSSLRQRRRALKRTIADLAPQVISLLVLALSSREPLIVSKLATTFGYIDIFLIDAVH
jgi:hypothetical protein